MTGSTQQGYLAMMLKGGRAVDGNRSKASGRTRAAARIVAGIAFLARAGDRRGARTLGKTEEPYWKRVFSGFDKSKEWLAKEKPDVCIGGARRNVAKSHYIRSQKGHWESRGRTYQARTLHRQGVFHPQARGQYLGDAHELTDIRFPRVDPGDGARRWAWCSIESTRPRVGPPDGGEATR
jgi:hypothetical protein